MAFITGLFASPAQAVVEFDWVRIGSPGNPCDVVGGVIPGCYGAVPYAFQISKFETTYAQYAEFLNAVAASDPNGLYDANMAGGFGFGGIVQSGSPGSFTYAVIAGFESKPAVFVSFYDVLRFANWLHN